MEYSKGIRLASGDHRSRSCAKRKLVNYLLLFTGVVFHLLNGATAASPAFLRTELTTRGYLTDLLTRVVRRTEERHDPREDDAAPVCPLRDQDGILALREMNRALLDVHPRKWTAVSAPTDALQAFRNSPTMRIWKRKSVEDAARLAGHVLGAALVKGVHDPVNLEGIGTPTTLEYGRVVFYYF